MSDKKQLVLLTGASGSMGFECFKLLWQERDRFNMVLLLRPSKKNKKKFKPYVGPELKIVWGDVLNREDVVEACRGIDWCLHTLALISPEADRQPEMADKVNARGTRYLVEAIEAENPEHIKMVYVGTVAKYGHRLPPTQICRTGDPVLPSVFDHYALSKVKGELAVMQSKIKHRVSLRQTFIMIPDLLSLKDPIMFHQPISSFMENITALDSGRMLLCCLDLADDSGFWGKYYNISGGPACRTTFLELLDGIYSMLGIRYQKVMDRNWFALKNFHMAFFEDSGKLNDYLHHWDGGQSMQDYFDAVRENFPWYLKITAWYCKYIPPFRTLVEALTRKQLKKLAFHSEGTMGWIQSKDAERIEAFYGSMEAYRSIPRWDPVKPSRDPSLNHQQDHRRLDHGYDESKAVLDLEDLRKAAVFRGGKLVSVEWAGEMHSSLSWTCCQKHAFEMSPHAVLKGGHWCPDCIAPPWNYSLLSERNPFAAQLINPSVKF